MDKCWTKMTNIINIRYVEGAKEFAEMLKLYTNDEGRASCSCAKCLNPNGQLADTIFHPIVKFGFDQSYDVWVNQGEILPDFEDIEESYEVHSSGEEGNDDVKDLLHDVFLSSDDEARNNADEGTNRSARHDDPGVEKLYIYIFFENGVEKIFIDIEKPLFPRC